ncbi:YjeF-related protein [Rhodotorula diobovata]|uniref:Enhancer of mRNA-decapping protein 3 n=1 Tax=Rhodotorula diobovata TaxID=5288 RepID=A0A5C5G3Y3_9BASI|nr:YjeF-related protein [Rhodotorula diobovata]
MATAFIGLPVRIRLKGDPSSEVTGVLSALDPVAGSLTLTEARSRVGETERLEGIRILSRSQVAGLELLSVSRTDASPSPQVPRQQAQALPQRQPQPAYHAHSPLPSPVPSPSPLSGSPGPGKQKQRGHRGGRRVRALRDALESEDGDEADVSSVSNEPRRSRQEAPAQSNHLSEDFDFGAGLASFNKHEVFEQIRSNDDTDPSLRLVAHNRNPSARSHHAQTKLLPTESVLSPSELLEQRAERRDVRAMVRQQAVVREPEGEGAGGKGGERSAGERLAEVQRQMNEIAVEDGGEAGPPGTEVATRLVTRKGIEVPTVTARQWKEALSIAEIESFPTPLQRLEASSHALTTHILTSLSLPPLSPPHSRPSICLLASDGTKGLVALRAGTTLANRGCRVVALVEEGGAGGEAWRTAVRVLSSAGGRIVRDVEDLPASFDLVVDALSSADEAPSTTLTTPRLGPSTSSSSSSSASPAPGTQRSSSSATFASTAAAWARDASAAPALLSLDAPYGANPDTGAPLTSSSPPLSPTHLLSFGLPRACLLAPPLATAPAHAPAPALAVADVGFPPALWARVGVVGEAETLWGVWGVEGVVLVERR